MNLNKAMPRPNTPYHTYVSTKLANPEYDEDKTAKQPVRAKTKEVKEIILSPSENISNLIIPLPRIIEVQQKHEETIDSILPIEILGTKSDDLQNADVSDSSQNDIVCGSGEPSTNTMPADVIREEENISVELTTQKFGIEKHIFSFRGLFITYTASFAFITLIPYHDVISCPNYWYELIFPFALGGLHWYFVLILLQLSKLLNDQAIMDLWLIIRLFTLSAIALTTSHITVYHFWSVCLGYNSPMPFVIIIDAILICPAIVLVLWKYFQKRYGNDSSIVSNLKHYCVYKLLTWILFIICLASLAIYLYANRYLQWLSLILIVFSKNIIGDFKYKFLCKAAVSEDFLTLQGISDIQVAVVYKSFVIMIMTSETYGITNGFVLVIPFLLNMHICFQVINLHQQISNDGNDTEHLHVRKLRLLMKLLINEIVEFLTPLIFLITFIIAYYGPNATIIGNVQNNYWQYGCVENLLSYVSVILLMTIVDLSSAVISVCLLWRICKINCWLFCKENMAELVKIMAVIMGLYNNGVSTINYQIEIIKQVKINRGWEIFYCSLK